MSHSVNLSPQHKLLKAVGIWRFWSSLIKSDIFADNYHIDVYSALVTFGVFSFDLCCIYTFCTVDMEGIINAASYLAVGLQGPPKLYIGYLQHATLRKIVLLLRHQYARIERSKDQQLKQDTAAFSHIYWILFCLLYILLAFAIVATLLYPVIMYYGFGIPLALIIPVRFPFIDSQQMGGYIATTVAHIGCVAIVVAGNGTIDSFCLTCILHAHLFTLRLKRSITRLENGIVQGMDSASVRRLLRKVLLSHQSYNNYVNSIFELFYIYFTVDLYTNALSLCMLVYVIQVVIVSKYIIHDRYFHLS